MNVVRRRALRATMLFAALLAFAASAPATASAAVLAATPNTCGGVDRAPAIGRPLDFHSDCPSYKGWGRITSEGAGSCIWNGCLRMPFTGPVTAWFWTGTAWHQSSLANGSSVYAWPYASGWSWAWNNGNWYAVQSTHIRINPAVQYF